MPVISIETAKIEDEQKTKLIEGFTKVASEALGIPEQSFIVLIKEYGFDNVASGGKSLTQIFKDSPA